MHQVLHQTTEVSPPDPQFQRIGPFTGQSGSLITMSATGLIGSGVLFTGQTPPGGWDNFLAAAGDTDWPYHGHPNAERYCLIARWEPQGAAPQDWFFVGNGRTLVVGFDPTLPAGTGKLRFAVNRPSPDTDALGPDRGDGAWEVTVDVFDPDPHDTPDCTTNPGPNEACMAITGTLAQMRVQAATMCEAITRAKNDRDATSTALWAAVVALGAATAALGAFAGVLVSTQGAIVAAATQAGVAAVGSPSIIGAIAASGVAIAEQIAVALPAALRAGWITLVLFAVLVALVVAAFIWLIAEIIELTMRNTDVSIARSNFAGQLAAIQDAIGRAAMVCCSFDDSLPACSDF